MIRILQVIGTMNRGGAETLVMEWYRHIDRRAIQFDFLIYGDGKGAFDDEILALGGRIFHAQKRFYKNPLAHCREINDFLLAHKEYATVHAHLTDMSGYIIWMAKHAGVRTAIAHAHVANPRTDLLRKAAWQLGLALIRRYADYSFACSSDALWYMTKRTPDRKTHFVLNNAIDIEKFRFREESRATWRKQLNAKDGDLVIGHIGRFTREKNHRFLLQAFRLLLTQNPNAMLVLVGDGSLRTAIAAMVKKYGMDNNVRLLGVRGDVQEIMSAFDLFAFPSRYEGLGIVLIEAQANGLPCLVSDTVPEEADVQGGMVTFLPIADEAVWADAMLRGRRTVSPAAAQQAVMNAGYDIRQLSEWLQQFYIYTASK